MMFLCVNLCKINVRDRVEVSMSEKISFPRFVLLSCFRLQAKALFKLYSMCLFQRARYLFACKVPANAIKQNRQIMADIMCLCIHGVPISDNCSVSAAFHTPRNSMERLLKSIDGITEMAFAMIFHPRCSYSRRHQEILHVKFDFYTRRFQ